MNDLQSGGAPERAYARFLPRLRALMIDSIIIVVAIFAALSIAVAVRSDDLARPLGFSVAALWLLYEPLLVAFAGGTIGHRLSNLRVVDDRTNGNVGLLKAFARTLIKAALGWVSFVTMLTTRRSQAVHDLLTRSTVQVRDLSRAGPRLYIGERRELASAAMPSGGRRALVVVGYVIIVTALFVATLSVVLMGGFISERCTDLGRCSSREDLILTAAAGAWIIGCLFCLVLGWRGRLYGARRAS